MELKKKGKRKKKNSLCESAVKLVYFRLHSYILCVEQQHGGGEGKGELHMASHESRHHGCMIQKLCMHNLDIGSPNA